MISRGLRKHPRLIGLIMERQGREKNNPASCWPWPLPGAAPSKRALISLLVVVCQINGPWRSDRWRPSRLIVPHAWTLSAVLGSLGSPKSRPSLAKCSSPRGTHPDPSKGAGKVRDAPRMGREVCPEDPKTEQRSVPASRHPWGCLGTPRLATSLRLGCVPGGGEGRAGAWSPID